MVGSDCGCGVIERSISVGNDEVLAAERVCERTGHRVAGDSKPGRSENHRPSDWISERGQRMQRTATMNAQCFEARRSRKVHDHGVARFDRSRHVGDDGVWSRHDTQVDTVCCAAEVFASTKRSGEFPAEVGHCPGQGKTRSTRPVVSPPGDPTAKGPGGGMGRRRVLVHSSGFQMSPYSDIKPAGEPAKDVARKLWHRSPGSPG